MSFIAGFAVGAAVMFVLILIWSCLAANDEPRDMLNGSWAFFENDGFEVVNVEGSENGLEFRAKIEEE